MLTWVGDNILQDTSTKTKPEFEITEESMVRYGVKSSNTTAVGLPCARERWTSFYIDSKAASVE